MSCVGIIVLSESGDQVVLVETKAGNLGYTKGKPKRRETLLETAYRETEEECGMTAEELDMVPMQKPLQEIKNGRLSVQYYVASTIHAPDFEFTFDGNELKRVRWYSIKDALEKLVLRRKKLLQEAVNLHFQFEQEKTIIEQQRTQQSPH